MSFQKQGSPESSTSSQKNMDTQTEYVQEKATSSKNDTLSFEELTGQKEGKYKIGTSEPPDFWRCICKLHIIPRPKKDEVTLTAKGTDPLYTGINKKEGMFDFPEASYKYIGSKPSPVEGRVRSASSSSSHRNTNINYNNESYMNKIKALEEKVQELENKNSNYRNTGLSTQNINPPPENRMTMNRTYYENRAAQYGSNKNTNRGGESSRNYPQGRRGGGRYPYRGGRGRGGEHGGEWTGSNNQ